MIEVRNLCKYFPVKKGLLRTTAGFVKAVDGVSFSVKEGETFGLVGESGSGKTTLGRLLVRLLSPDGGDILFRGRDIRLFGKKELAKFRRDAQIIFQDPFSSLNPRMKTGEIISEGLLLRKEYTASEIEKKCDGALEMVGLRPDHKIRYPHQFSGGQRQRIAIARAIILEPKFIVCDEPVSSLDVSIQAKILRLLNDLKRRLGLTYLFITHDLSVVANMCERVAVMAGGRIVETGGLKDVYTRPRAEYTKKLLNSIPVPDPRVR